MTVETEECLIIKSKLLYLEYSTKTKVLCSVDNYKSPNNIHVAIVNDYSAQVN